MRFCLLHSQLECLIKSTSLFSASLLFNHIPVRPQAISFLRCNKINMLRRTKNWHVYNYQHLTANQARALPLASNNGQSFRTLTLPVAKTRPASKSGTRCAVMVRKRAVHVVEILQQFHHGNEKWPPKQPFFSDCAGFLTTNGRARPCCPCPAGRECAPACRCRPPAAPLRRCGSSAPAR